MGYKPAKRKPGKGWIVDPSNYYYPSLTADKNPSFSSMIAYVGAMFSGFTGITSGIVNPGAITAVCGGFTVVFLGMAALGGKGLPADKVKVSDLFADDTAAALVDSVSKMEAGELNLIMHDLWHYVHYANIRGLGAWKDMQKLNKDTWGHLFIESKSREPQALKGYGSKEPSEHFEKVHAILGMLAPDVRWPSQAVDLAYINGIPVWTLPSGLQIYGCVVKAEDHRVPIQYSVNLASAAVSKHMEQLEELDKTAVHTAKISYGVTVEFRAYKEREAVIPPTVRYDLKAAERRYDEIKAAWTGIITDPLNALTHSSFFSNDDPLTDAFHKAFFKLEDALEALKAGDLENRDIVQELSIEAESKWKTALVSAERKSYSWLPPEQAESGRLAEKMLLLANNTGAKPGERASAARRAADLLDSITAVAFPREASETLALMGTRPKELEAAPEAQPV